MKTERRHELEHNDLADRVSSSLESLAPYGKQIVAVTVAVLVLVFGYRWYTNSALDREEKAWDVYFQAAAMQGPDSGGQNVRRSKLKEILANKNFTGTVAAAWAQLSLAEDELDRGIDLLFTSRSEGTQDLEKAKEHFQGAIKEAASLGGKHGAVIVPRAKVGLARAYESLGEVMEAIKTYKEVETKFALTAYKAVAQRRVTALEKDEAATFYDWLREQEPRRPSVPAGKGEPGLRPDFSPFDKDEPSAFDPANLTPKGGILPSDFDKPNPKKDPPKDEPEAGKKDGDATPPAKSEKPAEKPAQK